MNNIPEYNTANAVTYLRSLATGAAEPIEKYKGICDAMTQYFGLDVPMLPAYAHLGEAFTALGYNRSWPLGNTRGDKWTGAVGRARRRLCAEVAAWFEANPNVIDYCERNNMKLNMLAALGFEGSERDAESPGYIRVRCYGCAATVINGVPIHERGCPNEMHECAGCNELIPARQRYCADCS